LGNQLDTAVQGTGNHVEELGLVKHGWLLG